uniref:Uncharacterized protein n=1 Tax=viral metagenome TaxID=1070528 RepID=A0A6C0CJ53_9ZZZZ
MSYSVCNASTNEVLRTYHVSDLEFARIFRNTLTHGSYMYHKNSRGETVRLREPVFVDLPEGQQFYRKSKGDSNKTLVTQVSLKPGPPLVRQGIPTAIHLNATDTTVPPGHFKDAATLGLVQFRKLSETELGEPAEETGNVADPTE